MAARERINEGVVKRHSPLSSLLALNDFSFKGLDLSDASRQELEALRRWLEVQRRATEVRARRTERDLKRGKASLDEFKASQTVREEAIINYQHGIQAYIEASRNL